jgi:hypothetical protein
LPVETVFLIVSYKQLFKMLKQSLFNFNIKVFVTSDSKSTMDQFEEFCEEYLGKLKIRTDEHGVAL